MRTRASLLTIAALLMLSGCDEKALASRAAASLYSEYRYQPCIVALHGTIKTTWTYGPPNFGDPKTDKKIAIYVLVLDHRINIRGSDVFDAAKGVSEVQLYFPRGGPSIPSKQQVTVVGKLQQATTATDIYPVVMQVSAIKP